MNRKFIILNIFVLILFIYYFKENIIIDELLEILITIKPIDIIIIFTLFLLRPILITLRWFLLVRNFTKIHFLEFFKNIIIGSSLNFITSSSIAIEIVKFTKIKKYLGINKSIFLVFLDKIYTLIFKIIFLIIIFNLFNHYIIKTYVIEFLSISISLFCFAYLFRIKLFKIFNKLIKNKHNLKISELLSILMTTNKNFLALFLTNLVIQLLNIYLYYIIFVAYGGNINLFEISIFVPLIDFVSQMQFMFIGLKEFSTVYFSKYINITNEIALTGALSHRVFDAISVIFLFVIFNFLNTNSKKN